MVKLLLTASSITIALLFVSLEPANAEPKPKVRWKWPDRLGVECTLDRVRRNDSECFMVRLKGAKERKTGNSCRIRTYSIRPMQTAVHDPDCYIQPKYCKNRQSCGIAIQGSARADMYLPLKNWRGQFCKYEIRYKVGDNGDNGCPRKKSGEASVPISGESGGGGLIKMLHVTTFQGHDPVAVDQKMPRWEVDAIEASSDFR